MLEDFTACSPAAPRFPTVFAFTLLQRNITRLPERFTRSILRRSLVKTLHKFVKWQRSCHIKFTAFTPSVLPFSPFQHLRRMLRATFHTRQANLTTAPIQFPGNIPKRWLYQAAVISPLQLVDLTLSFSFRASRSSFARVVGRWKFPSLSRRVFLVFVHLRNWFSSTLLDDRVRRWAKVATTICANEERKRTKRSCGSFHQKGNNCARLRLDEACEREFTTRMQRFLSLTLRRCLRLVEFRWTEYGIRESEKYRHVSMVVFRKQSLRKKILYNWKR